MKDSGFCYDCGHIKAACDGDQKAEDGKSVFGPWMKVDRVYDYLSVVRRPILSRNESVEGSSSLGASPSLAKYAFNAAERQEATSHY